MSEGEREGGGARERALISETVHHFIGHDFEGFRRAVRMSTDSTLRSARSGLLCT